MNGMEQRAGVAAQTREEKTGQALPEAAMV